MSWFSRSRLQSVPLSRVMRQIAHEHDNHVANYYNHYHHSFSPFSPAFDDLFFSRRGGSNVLNKFFRAIDSQFDQSNSQQQQSNKKDKHREARDNANANTNSTPTTNNLTQSTAAVKGSNTGSVQRYHNPFSPSPFSSLWTPFFSNFPSHLNPILPTITLNVYSTPSNYQIEAELPGVKKEEIVITVEKGTLTIEAERKEERDNRRKNSSPSTKTSSANATQSTGNVNSTESNNVADATATSGAAAAAAASSNSSGTNGGRIEAKNSTWTENEDEIEELHVESQYGKVSRSISLPDDAVFDNMTAKYENGVIKIEVPRKQLPKDEKKIVQLQ